MFQKSALLPSSGKEAANLV